MSNLRYWMTTLKSIKIYDKETIQEFKTYVRQANGVWKKQSDRYLDDRVEALIWALFVLEPKIIEQFYEVLEKDGNGKPLKVLPLNWDPYEVLETKIPSQEDLYKRFNKKEQAEIQSRNPIFFNEAGEKGELGDLISQGWKPVNFNSASGRMNGLLF